eukprot:TRINITY_DN1377_c0_g1_i4.p2 TRINITY_DN1377_c0_g1~~TRINITY_DN1377_c0_g1_i4.p2  ORF type:complete len:100 (-),score=27.59 TRINITY_DN1377_c0_g1_i4:18-317(-)
MSRTAFVAHVTTSPSPQLITPSRACAPSLTDRVKDDDEFNYHNVIKFYKTNSATYPIDEGDGRSIYGIPLDGDFHYFYYRTDLFKKYDLDVPRTWYVVE